MEFLLIDFGTSSTKATRLDLETGTFSTPITHNALENCAPIGLNHFEYDLQQVLQRFNSICEYFNEQRPFSGIVLCSEMHGYAVLDTHDKPLTPYISWKDERSETTTGGKPSSFAEICSVFGEDFRSITGMNPRPGFMPMSLLRLSRTQRFPANIPVVDLPGWISRIEGRSTNHIHPTMLAGLASFDIDKKKPSQEILGWLSNRIGTRISTDMPGSIQTISGYWRDIPIYAGIGDHQCSLIGAGLIESDILSVNLGTGAQVSVVDPIYCPIDAEIRPYFSKQVLRTITHIPGGRALTTHIDFLQQLAGEKRNIWEELSLLDSNAINKGTLRFDLSLFPGARGYNNGGSIMCITEGEFTSNNYLRSLIRSFAEQFIEIATYFDQNQNYSQMLLSGGIPRRVIGLAEYIEQRTKYKVKGATALDESLLGLRAIALAASGKTSDVRDGQKYFGRDVTIVDT